MPHLPHLRAVLADWPELPEPDQFLPDDQPVPDSQRPAPKLRWRDIRPAVLPFDRATGARTACLLQAAGAPAPVALVSYQLDPGARHGKWTWRCEVHVITAPDMSEGFAFDCPAAGRSTTYDSARLAAADHITGQHPDIAVPYLGRRQHALRRWA
jgi:hypothetical protein